MNVLIYHDRSGLVRKAFAKLNHNAHNCEDDVFSLIKEYAWDLLIAFPPCTYLTLTGNRWFLPQYKDRFPDRLNRREKAIKIVMRLAHSPIERICIENPVGVMSRVWRKPDQYVHPYYFGQPHAKKTCLWLKNLPELKPTKMVEPEYYTYKNGKRDGLWHVSTIFRKNDYSQYLKNLQLPADERSKARARILIKGMDKAMAKQWGGL